MVALPRDTPVKEPPDDIVATAEGLLAHTPDGVTSLKEPVTASNTVIPQSVLAVSNHTVPLTGASVGRTLVRNDGSFFVDDRHASQRRP